MDGLDRLAKRRSRVRSRCRSQRGESGSVRPAELFEEMSRGNDRWFMISDAEQVTVPRHDVIGPGALAEVEQVVVCWIP